MNNNTLSIQDPIAILTEEHREAFERLSKLEDAINSMDENGFNKLDFYSLVEYVRYFDSNFRLHDRKEEEVVFPLLEKYKPGITNEFKVEHRELWSSFGVLLSCIRDVQEGRLHGSSRQELVKTSKRIIALLRNHMMNENTFLFSQLKSMVSSSEYEELSNKIAQIDR